MSISLKSSTIRIISDYTIRFLTNYKKKLREYDLCLLHVDLIKIKYCTHTLLKMYIKLL